MTDKQTKFANEYLIDLNATQAAIRAGYPEKTARSIGCENLTKPDISDLIADLKKQREERTTITADKVLKTLAQLTFSDIRDYYNEDGTLKNIKDLPDDAAAALSSVEVDELFEMEGRVKIFTGYTKKVKLFDKLGGVEKLMKHLGLYSKDNAQNKPVIVIPPPQVYNTAPPLPNTDA